MNNQLTCLEYLMVSFSVLPSSGFFKPFGNRGYRPVTDKPAGTGSVSVPVWIQISNLNFKKKNSEKIPKNTSWFIESNGVKIFQIGVRLLFILTCTSLKKKEKGSFLFFSKLVRVKINSKRTPIWKKFAPFDSTNHELFLGIFSAFSIFFFKFEIWFGAEPVTVQTGR